MTNDLSDDSTPTLKKNDLTQFLSKTEKESRTLKKTTVTEKLASSIKKLKKEVATPTMSEAEKYKKAWDTIYNGLKGWRKQEIDEQLKTGKLSDSRADTDFVQQVINLAEK